MVRDRGNGRVGVGGTGGDSAGDGVGGQNDGLRRNGNRLRKNFVWKGDTGSTRVQARGRKGRRKKWEVFGLKTGQRRDVPESDYNCDVPESG